MATADATLVRGAPPGPGEDRFLVRGIPWTVYVAMRDALDARGDRLRLTYLAGDLELMSPSPEHDGSSRCLFSLVTAFCEERGVDIFAHGSTTYRTEQGARGLEADESFSIGTRKPVPDLAIEVVYSSWRVDKLDVYRVLAVPEVWIYRDSRISVHRLRPAGYEPTLESSALPGIDLARLAEFVDPEASITSVVRAYRATLRRA